MLLLRLLSHLPLSVLYLIRDFLYYFSRYIIRYRRKLVGKNLRNSFPEKSNAELLSIEKQLYIKRSLIFFVLLMLSFLRKAKLNIAGITSILYLDYQIIKTTITWLLFKSIKKILLKIKCFKIFINVFTEPWLNINK